MVLTHCYIRGAVAGALGKTVDANPYTEGTQEHADWLVGYGCGIDAEMRRSEMHPATIDECGADSMRGFSYGFADPLFFRRDN